MTEAVERLKEQAEKLSAEERAELVYFLLQSLESEENGAEREPPPLTEAQKRELQRRIAALDANPDAVSPWEEVEARVLGRLRP